MLWLAAAPRKHLQWRRASAAAGTTLQPLNSGRAVRLRMAQCHNDAHCSKGADACGGDKKSPPGTSATLAGNQWCLTRRRGEADQEASAGERSSLGGSVARDAPGQVRSPVPAVATDSSKPAAMHWGFSPIPFVARGRSMPGQRLLPCSPEDASILASSQSKYPSPQEVEGGIIVRIIAAKDAHKVTSPVLRVVRNRQYGIRKGERLRLALGGAFFSAVLTSLGVWQLRRMEEKKQLIEYRRSHLAMQPTVIVSSPFPWTLEAAANSEKRKRHESAQPEVLPSGLAKPPVGRGIEASALATGASTSALKATSSLPETCIASADPQQQPGCETASIKCVNVSRKDGDATGLPETRRQRSGRLLASASPDDVENAVTAWAYTPVVLHGILDSSTELLVGPRPGLDVGNPGYCVVSPLRLQDGSVILVNKGHLPVKLAKLPPFPRAVDEESELFALVQQQRRQLARQQTAALQQPEEQVKYLQQQQPRLRYVDSGSQQRLEQLQELAGSRTEPVGAVTVRGVLEPGEVANSSFKSLMLKNRPQDGQFLVVNPKDLVEAVPGVPNRAEAGLLMVNAYSIVYDDDLLHSSTDTTGSVSRVANMFMSYQQKQKADYLLFYADEHTHFNYACQWFLMGLCTAAMTLYKIVEVSRWRW